MKTRTKVLFAATVLGGLGAVVLLGPGDPAVPAAPPVHHAVPLNVVVPDPPTQPLPFSHAIHAGALEIDCRTCHSGAQDAADAGGQSPWDGRMTFPDTGTCMACHETIATESPAIQNLAGHHAAKTPVAWRRVFQVLKGVRWSHQWHLKAGVACETCHGPVAELKVMAQTTAVTAMASCIGCHQAYGASAICHTCHAWPTAEQLRE